jgi:hypothetical protein
MNTVDILSHNTISIKMGDFGDFGNFCCFWKIYILIRFELNNKKLYIYLSHFVKFGTWNFPILMEMVFHASTSKKMRTHAFNRILVQYSAKLKWEDRRMGWHWFLSLNVYGITPVFFPLVLKHCNVEWKLFNKVCDPLIIDDIHSLKANEPCWLSLVLNGPLIN